LAGAQPTGMVARGRNDHVPRATTEKSTTRAKVNPGSDGAARRGTRAASPARAAAQAPGNRAEGARTEPETREEAFAPASPAPQCWPDPRHPSTGGRARDLPVFWVGARHLGGSGGALRADLLQGRAVQLGPLCCASDDSASRWFYMAQGAGRSFLGVRADRGLTTGAIMMLFMFRAHC